jgi:hypothetical protein
MKENKMKQVYLTPAVQVKVVAVENGFQVSYGMTEQVFDGGHIDF